MTHVVAKADGRKVSKCDGHPTLLRMGFPDPDVTTSYKEAIDKLMPARPRHSTPSGKHGAYLSKRGQSPAELPPSLLLSSERSDEVSGRRAWCALAKVRA